MNRWFNVFARFDWLLMFAAVSLTSLGLLIIYGINISRGEGFFQFYKQLLAAALGLALVAGLAWLDYRQIRSVALPLYLVCLGLLLLALVVGTSSHGGGRWFTVGALSFQPVEPAKVALALFLAAYLGRHAHKRLGWTAFLGSALATGAYVIPTMLQPDLGSATVLMAMWGAAVLFCGLPRHAWWIGALSVVVLLSVLWTVGLKPYQRDRITSFINPSIDPYGASYNVAQARIAVGSGWLFGKGVGEGSQARLRFLPEASTDFMFAVVGEELGFVGVALVLGLFGLLLSRLLRVGQQAGNAYAGILTICLSAIVAYHLLVSAGMNLGVLPVTGIPLPFLSAAATSVLSMFCIVGLGESVCVHSGNNG